jgi:hypothetical protein
VNENLKIVKAKIQRYRWLLQTNLTKARRKLVAEMLGEQERELKKQKRLSGRSWARRLLRGLPFGRRS